MNRTTAILNEMTETKSPMPIRLDGTVDCEGGERVGQASATMPPGIRGRLYRGHPNQQRAKTVANEPTESKRKVTRMVITTTISNGSNGALTPEGIYVAVVKAVSQVEKAPKPNQTAEIKIEFTVEGVAETMEKKYPAVLAGRSPLKREAQAILGRNLAQTEVARFDTDVLLKRPCRVIVVHQAEGGGKPKARIKAVLGHVAIELPTPEAVLAN